MPNFFTKPKKIFNILRGKHKKFILGLLLIFLVSSLGIFVFGAGEARAEWFNIGYSVLAWIFVKIGSLIKAIVSMFFWISSQILEMAFGLEKFTKAEVVKIGWGITRDIANMLFVVGLLIIAGATALNIEQYGLKKLLPKLIIAALLINFSLVMAGIIIDFTQVLTHFFYDEINTGNGITAQISQSLNISKVPELNPDADVAKKLATGIAGIIMLIFSIIVEIILISSATLAIAIGAFFLIVRVIAIWILLILAPLAWLMWILPATQHLFQKWWTNFFKWSFFAPIYAFFIYLACATSSKEYLIDSKMKEVVDASGWKETMWSAMTAAPELFMQFLVIIGLLFGGLIVAQKMSIYGAKGAIGIAKGVGGKVSGVTAVQQRWKARKAVKEGETKERVKRKMGLRRVGGGIGSIGQMARERLRPTAAGRAEARAKKDEIIKEEAQRMGKVMNWKDVTKQAGKRITPTSAGRAQKLAAQSLLANPDSEAYGQMMSKPIKIPRTKFIRGRIGKLANRVDAAVSRKKKKGTFVRYTPSKKSKEEKTTQKTKVALTGQEKPKVEVVTPAETGGVSSATKKEKK